MAVVGDNIINESIVIKGIRATGIVIEGLVATPTNYLLLEDGGFIILEDGSGNVLTE